MFCVVFDDFGFHHLCCDGFLVCVRFDQQSIFNQIRHFFQIKIVSKLYNMNHMYYSHQKFFKYVDLEPCHYVITWMLRHPLVFLVNWIIYFNRIWLFSMLFVKTKCISIYTFFHSKTKKKSIYTFKVI